MTLTESLTSYLGRMESEAETLEKAGCLSAAMTTRLHIQDLRGMLGAFETRVLCPESRSVPEGFECPHSCRPGECKGCPAEEGVEGP